MKHISVFDKFTDKVDSNIISIVDLINSKVSSGIPTYIEVKKMLLEKPFLIDIFDRTILRLNKRLVKKYNYGIRGTRKREIIENLFALIRGLYRHYDYAPSDEQYNIEFNILFSNLV